MSTQLTQGPIWQRRLSAMRDEAIDCSVALLAALSLPTLALVLLRATVVGWQPGMAVSIGLAAVLCGTYLARGRLPAATKAAVALGVLFVAALDGLLSFGLASYGALYLAAAVVLATLLLGPRWGLRALGAAVALACALALAVAAHRLTIPVDLNAYNKAAVDWLALPVTLAWPAGTLLAVGGKVYAALVEEVQVSAERAAALERSERDFRLLAENSADVIVRYTPEMQLLYASPAVRQLLGFAPEEVVGRASSEFVHPDDRAAAEQARRRVQTEGMVGSATYRCLRADGSYVWVESVGRAVRDEDTGEIVEIQVATRDISARKAAEELLARANTELETIFRVLPIGIGIADDPAISRIRMNPAGARMLGLPPEANASLGAPEGERPTTFRVYQGGRELAVEELPFNVTAATGREVRDLELEVVRDDGARVTQLVYTTPLRDEEGRVRGVVGAYLDITALRELERAREGFLVAAAHDLRTPLTAIRGWVQIARQELERLEAPETAPVVSQLGRALERADGMLAQIRELGEVARLRLGGALDLQPRPTDLVALVQSAVEAQRSVSARTIELEAGPGELHADVDPERVGRVVGNLLANAVKYSAPETAIRVRLGREAGPGGPWAVLSVRDEGVGIPAADLPHIFDLFRRGSNVAGLAEGAGIGLASAWSVVEQHGGRIGVESAEGAGATFTVRLPLRPPALPGTPS